MANTTKKPRLLWSRNTKAAFFRRPRSEALRGSLDHGCCCADLPGSAIPAPVDPRPSTACRHVPGAASHQRQNSSPPSRPAAIRARPPVRTRGGKPLPHGSARGGRARTLNGPGRICRISDRQDFTCTSRQISRAERIAKDIPHNRHKVKGREGREYVAAPRQAQNFVCKSIGGPCPPPLRRGKNSAARKRSERDDLIRKAQAETPSHPQWLARLRLFHFRKTDGTS